MSQSLKPFPIRTAAAALHEYMTFRASQEGVKHTFTEGFYASSLARGVRLFFGIEVADTGDLVCDHENPGTFAAYFHQAPGWRLSRG
jgi:hypothetical protein